MHTSNSFQKTMTNSEELCCALYLTQPSPLWNREVPGHTFNDIRSYQTQLVKTELAIHSPHIVNMSEHRLNEVSGYPAIGVLQSHTPPHNETRLHPHIYSIYKVRLMQIKP